MGPKFMLFCVSWYMFILQIRDRIRVCEINTSQARIRSSVNVVNIFYINIKKEHH